MAVLYSTGDIEARTCDKGSKKILIFDMNIC